MVVLQQSPEALAHLRHADRQFADLAHDARPTHSTMRIRPLGRDEPAVPAENRFRCHDRRDLPQGLAAQRLALRGQPAALILGEAQALPARLELLLEDFEFSDTTGLYRKTVIFSDSVRFPART